MGEPFTQDNLEIPWDYFVAEENSNGDVKGWTLTSILGDMLALAEDMFGRRDHTYTILGIEFVSSGPQCWYSTTGNQIIVQLDLDCLNDQYDACVQLAHECIHLLSPTRLKDANVLEEGVAVYFQGFYMRKTFGSGWWDNDMVDANYQSALTSVDELLRIEPDAIKMLREHEPTISRISSDLIISLIPAVNPVLAHELSRSFCTD